MLKSVFIEYCEKIKAMTAAGDKWRFEKKDYFAGVLGDLYETVFGHVLAGLSANAYEILNERRSGTEVDLHELAGLLYVKSYGAESVDFKPSAYYFAVCVMAVALGIVSVDDIDENLFDENEMIGFDGTAALADAKDPQERKLKRYAVRLLDFSRNNQLVHFRPLKSGTLLLYSSSNRALIGSFLRGRKIFIRSWRKLGVKTLYRCRFCGRYAVGEYDVGKKAQNAMACPSCDAQSIHGRKSMIPLKEALTVVGEQSFSCSCGCKSDLKAIEANDFKCPDCGKFVDAESFPLISPTSLSVLSDGEVVSGVGDATSKETCKTLVNKAKTMQRNFGLHVLYMAYGFLKWKDSSGTEYNSPILLCPVNINLDKTAGDYYFEADASSGGFEVNKTLKHMLSSYSSSCSIILPPLADSNLDRYLNVVRQILASSGETIAAVTEKWSVDEKIGLGLFHYQKLQLENDIKENVAEYLNNPIIRRLCDDAECDIGVGDRSEDYFRYMLLDADSSQEEVIAAAMSGKSFVLQGPPGSGKSQTITNIISTATGSGKTVLFVTQKASARSIIIDNLTRCSSREGRKLTDFVLDFDAFSKRGGAISREPFVNELNDCANRCKPIELPFDASIEEEKLYKAKIRAFMDNMRLVDKGKNLVQILQETAPYLDECVLDNIADMPSDAEGLTALKHLLNEYYSLVKGGVTALNYQDDRLFGFKGDPTGRSAVVAQGYKDNAAAIRAVASRMAAYGWISTEAEKHIDLAQKALAVWAGLNALNETILFGLNAGKTEGLLSYATERRNELQSVLTHVGAGIEKDVALDKFSSFDYDEYSEKLNKYSFFVLRIGKAYTQLLSEIFSYYLPTVEKHTYAAAKSALEKLGLYEHFADKRSVYRSREEEDILRLGVSPNSVEQWDKIISDLKGYKSAFDGGHDAFIAPSQMHAFIMSFAPSAHASTVGRLFADQAELAAKSEKEKSLRAELSGYFDKGVADEESAKLAAELVLSNKWRLAAWQRVLSTVAEVRSNGFENILNELFTRNCDTFEKALFVVNRTYFEKVLRLFENDHGINTVSAFNRVMHEALLKDYAAADVRSLEGGADRLYSVLAERLSEENLRLTAAAGNIGGQFKLQSKTGYSIKRTITENFDYIKRVKPCFMMSPLNVSQYIDISVKFDLIIFDEASQIFTEDALASIVRGKQIIIAGDSKQLPPCDFFRAGEVTQDDADTYFEEERENNNSLLDAADKALVESSVSLAWHYRSCDESLIAFSNKYMNYGLISFPSAIRNPNDGIFYENVPYKPSTCYVAGKGGSHVNIGEADRVVELIWKEITSPERGEFSVGVVAFSNAQAFEIESRWEVFKSAPDKRAYVDAWENRHESEPIIFCNLDTMQGDERDTMILSICYGKDAKGKFNLPYLGRIRLSSGKKRINVAITRSRHRMIVVSTLDAATLNSAINLSAAPDENKEGAKMLADFLGYASSFSAENAVVQAPTENLLVKSVCKAISVTQAAYDTEIGRSDCKISIGIRNPKKPDSYVLGIIIDDPRRTDFDSPREYARLTEQVLTQKYNWNIYRVYPAAWIYDNAAEKTKLINAVRNALRRV